MPPVSDTGVSLTRPTGDILDITSTNLERFSIEPSPDVPLTKNTCLRLIEAMHRFIVGDDDLVELLFVCLLAEGNVLWTGDPGIAKTTIAELFARALGCEFNYGQFNPDVLPSDVLGSYVFDQETQEHCLRKGGIFANIVMLDELNRASPRTRAALLTSMEEKSVTIEGTPLALEKAFHGDRHAIVAGRRHRPAAEGGA